MTTIIIALTEKRKKPIHAGFARRNAFSPLCGNDSSYRVRRVSVEIDFGLLDEQERELLRAVEIASGVQSIYLAPGRPIDYSEVEMRQFAGCLPDYEYRRINPPEYTQEAQALPLHRWLRQQADILRIKYRATAFRLSGVGFYGDWVAL